MLLVCSIDSNIQRFIIWIMWNCAYNFCYEFCLPQGGRDAKSEPGYKLENGVVKFPLSFRMLRSCGNAVFAFEDVFWEEESHLRWCMMKKSHSFLFPNSRNLLFALSFVHLDLCLEHVISEIEVKWMWKYSPFLQFSCSTWKMKIQRCVVLSSDIEL